ncbi:MAG: hypothetical protein GXY58_13855 [Planctomycetaceae bacterium]|nr:hypothetical protein [Planctomycetaceae bacterium]
MTSMMWMTILLWLQATPTMDVSLEALSGPTRSGMLVALDDQQVVVDVDSTRETLDLRDLLALTFTRAPRTEPAPASVWIELIDGSRLEATSYTVTNRVAAIRIGDRTVPVETHNILSVRFHPPSPDLDLQWQELLRGRASGDIVVLRRSKTSLDQLEGVFHDVTEEVVDFEFDEQRIAVKREKLEGIVYFHAAPRELPGTICRVQETNGSVWQARSLELAGELLRVTTTSGTRCDIPIPQLLRCDFSAGNVTYLSDLEYELVECLPFIGTRLPDKRILQLYAPHTDASFEGSGLWLGAGNDIRQYEKGLSIHSRSVLVYRLQDAYRKLTADVGIDSRVQGRGNVVLIIKGDDKELLRRSVAGTDPPLALDLNIEGVRRLEILVDFGETLDVADHLNLCNARIIK